MLEQQRRCVDGLEPAQPWLSLVWNSHQFRNPTTCPLLNSASRVRRHVDTHSPKHVREQPVCSRHRNTRQSMHIRQHVHAVPKPHDRVSGLDVAFGNPHVRLEAAGAMVVLAIVLINNSAMHEIRRQQATQTHGMPCCKGVVGRAIECERDDSAHGNLLTTATLQRNDVVDACALGRWLDHGGSVSVTPV